MSKLIVYQKPTCSTCRKVLQILNDEGADFAAINYYEDRFTAAQLKDLLQKAGMGPRDILRTKETVYTTLALGKQSWSDDELIAFMTAHPDLIERPIVQKDDRVILARPPERVRELLSATTAQSKPPDRSEDPSGRSYGPE